MELRFRKALDTDCSRLTEIAHAAKRHWGYPEAWILLWRDELTFTSACLEQHVVQIAEADDRVVGVYSLSCAGKTCEVEHLWLLPDSIGHGIGRRLFEKMCATARDLGALDLNIAADPNAEGFYLHLGAERIGDVPSKPEGRRLPLLRYKLVA